MAASAVQNPPTHAIGESKSALKKKAKAEAAAGINGESAAAAPTSSEALKENSSAGDIEVSSEHPYLRELGKQIRNINKKLSGTQKTDAIIAQNPGVSLDDLVAQRKINADQKASALKKPQLQTQLAQLEEQCEQYRKFDAEFQQKLINQKEELDKEHQAAVKKLREDLRSEATTTSTSELRQKLLTLSKFLRAAAHKRTLEDEADSEESKAFEGALLLVYGGDQKAVDTAINLIEGSEDQVPSIEGIPLSVSFSQIKQASVDHAPFQTEEAWVESVAEATGDANVTNGSDLTISNAGLTELQALEQTNGLLPNGKGDTASAKPVPAEDTIGNVAGERWDTSGGAENSALEDSYEVIPRPADEVDNPTASSAAISHQHESASWADEPPPYETAAPGNAVGEAWDSKAAGEQAETEWSTKPTQAAPPAPADDGFHEVSGRHRGRGRGRGDGDFRGRGSGRGRGRGGRGARGGPEFRGGRGGRGGPRGGQGSGTAPHS